MTRLIIAGKNRVLLKKTADGLRLPSDNDVRLADGAETFSFGGYAAVPLSGCLELAEGVVECGLRESWKKIPDCEYEAASKGAELLNWSEAERFCCRCGAPLKRATEISKKCQECGAEYFPRLNPAVVALVTRGDEALLVHAKTLKEGVHALVAGFVETGESLEECVRREIREETSLEVDSVRYFGSQAWPFPFQLMVGFTARYKSGEVRFADGELSAVAFFTRDSLPTLPSMPSLSRRIIDAWIGGSLPESEA